jgi:hypothetical protein
MGEPYKGLAGAAVSPVLYRIVRDGLGIDSPWMGPGRPTKGLGKRSVPVELDYPLLEIEINLLTGPGTLWRYNAISINKQTNSSG